MPGVRPDCDAALAEIISHYTSKARTGKEEGAGGGEELGTQGCHKVDIITHYTFQGQDR